MLILPLESQCYNKKIHQFGSNFLEDRHITRLAVRRERKQNVI